jgi:hypothetical protein
MNITEIFEYAKEKGEEIEFQFTNLKGQVVKCKTLDAYMGLFQMGHNNGFIREQTWKEMTGDIFDFTVINEDGNG